MNPALDNLCRNRYAWLWASEISLKFHFQCQWACLTVSLSLGVGSVKQTRENQNPWREEEKHSCHCNISSSLKSNLPTTAWTLRYPLESRVSWWVGGWQRGVLGEHLREVFYALGDAILCAAGALTGLDTEEKPRWQRKMEGIKHPHRQPQPLPLLSLSV